MSAEEPTRPDHDARMLADLRQWRHSPRVSRELDAGKDAFLSREELDMLLRIADERDALRRQAADMPDETPTGEPYRFGSHIFGTTRQPSKTCTRCGISLGDGSVLSTPCRQAAEMPDETPRQRWEASRAPIAESFTSITAVGRRHDWGPIAVCTDIEALATACRRCGVPLVRDVTDRTWETRDGLAALRMRADCSA